MCIFEINRKGIIVSFQYFAIYHSRKNQKINIPASSPSIQYLLAEVGNEICQCIIGSNFAILLRHKSFPRPIYNNTSLQTYW